MLPVGMKCLCGLFALLWVTEVSSFGQFFFLTRYDRNGNLQWTNLLCTTRPVYEILRAQSLTGSWTHVAYVTNQTSYTLSNAIPSGSSAFYKLAWVDEPAVVLDYAFDEGFGFPSVTGELTLDFSSLSASWNFEDAGFYDGPHPLGVGAGLIGFSNDLRIGFVLLRAVPDDTVYLAGSLQSSSTASGCEYTGYRGAVFHITLGGTDQLGDFVALKSQ